MTKSLTELFDEKVAAPKSDPFHYEGVGIKIESTRRKPIDLATKKLIEALEVVAGNRASGISPELMHLMNLRNWKTANEALAEFRASLEDGE